MPHHYWLTCFSIPMRTSFYVNSLRRAKESLLENSISHIAIMMTLPISIIKNTSVASYLDLLFTGDENNITTKLHDRRDAFGFQIVNFPFMSSNIPSAPAYGVSVHLICLLLFKV